MTHFVCLRLVDMQHILVLQLEKRAEVLTVVTERILTTNSCSVTMTKKQQCTFQGVLGLMGLLGGSVKVGPAAFHIYVMLCIPLPP